MKALSFGFRCFAILTVLVWKVASLANADQPDFRTEHSRLQQATSGTVRIIQHTATGYARFVTFSDDGIGLDPILDPTLKAAAFFSEFGGVFGITNADSELILTSIREDRIGMKHLRYRQVHGGVPVLDAQIRVHFWPNGRLRAVNGTFIADISLAITPSLTGGDAKKIAIETAAAELGTTAEDFRLDKPQKLYLFRENLGLARPGANHLVWEIVPRSSSSREFFYVDAHSGAVVERRPTIARAINRQEYLPGCFPHVSCGPLAPTCKFNPVESKYFCSDDGTQECQEDSECHRTCDVTPEGDTCVWEEGDTFPFECDGGTPNCPTADKTKIETAVNKMILYSNDTRDFFSCLDDSEINWDLTTDGPMHGYVTISSSDDSLFYRIQEDPLLGWVHIEEKGMADDIVAHEWAHGYSFATHNLNGSYQPGALKESFSDIWGELVDQFNGEGEDGENETRIVDTCSEHDSNPENDEEKDKDSYRWLIAEDAEENFRDMWEPTCLGDPGKTSDEEYSCGALDFGGVHANAGVPNHAFALLVDGGTYNGETVSSLLESKAAGIYWRAQTVYQGPSTTFADHADALVTACDDLVDTTVPDLNTCHFMVTITQADCDAVGAAMRAVEMCSATCWSCPTTSNCTGQYCTDGAQIANNNQFYEHCELPNEQIFECGVGNSIHKLTFACDWDRCCEQSPPCVCCSVGTTKVSLSCEPAVTSACLAYP